MLCYKICYWFSEWIEFLHITRRHLFSDPVFFIMIQSENIYIVDFLLGILSVRFVWRSEIMQLYGKFNRSRPRLCKRYICICIIFSAHCLIGNIHSLILKFSSIQRLLGIPTISIYPLLDVQSWTLRRIGANRFSLIVAIPCFVRVDLVPIMRMWIFLVWTHEAHCSSPKYGLHIH